MAQSGLFIYSLDLLTHKPDLLCDINGQFVSCKVVDVCLDNQINPDVNFKINWDSKYSLHNWIEDLDLLCAPSIKIGLFGTLFFLGFACTGLLMSFMKEIPRRKLFIIG